MLPKQRTTLKQKNSPVNADSDSGYTWFNQTADYYIDQFSYDNQFEEIEKLQNAVEGIIDLSEYSHLLNPFNMDNSKDYKVGARLRNHNVLKGVVYLMLGEFSRRTQAFSVTCDSSGDDNKFKEGLAQQLRSYYEQETINQLNQAGVPTGQDSEEQGTPQEVEQEYKASFDSERVLLGQSAIDYIANNQDVMSKTIEIYYDWITTGLGYSYKCIRDNDVEYEHVPVKELYVPNETNKMVEDSSFVVRRRILPLSKIIDYYGDQISEADFNRLEGEYYNQSSFYASSRTVKAGARGFLRLPTINSSDESYASSEEAEGIPVFHVQWRSFEKYGILTYEDDLKQLQTMEVSDDYVLDKTIGDISIEWKWDTCICEDTRIGDDIHCYSRIVEENRRGLEGRGNKKLLYNGIKQRSKSGTIQSFVKEGYPYQLLINSLHYQLEKIINKNKDKITVIPYGLIPRKKGMSTKDTMYHMDATSILWIDETAPNASFAAQMIKTLDMGLGSYIKDIYDLILMIKQEYWDAIGMNGQRYSNIDQGSGKGVTEQAIVRSAIITYDLNRQMDKLIEKDYAGFLDLSKVAWINGKKAKYVLSDGSQAMLQLNPEDALYYAESNYNVFVKDSTELSESIVTYRNLLTQFAQQQGSMEAAAEILSNNNVEKLKSIVGKIEANNKKHEAYVASIQGEQQQKLQEAVNADKAADRELAKYKVDMAYQQTVDSANIRTKNNSRNEARPANEIETMMAGHTINSDYVKESQKERELNQRDKELALKNKQIEISKSKTNGK